MKCQEELLARIRQVIDDYPVEYEQVRRDNDDPTKGRSVAQWMIAKMMQ